MNPNKKIRLSEIRNTVGQAAAIVLRLVMTSMGWVAGRAACRAFASGKTEAGIILALVALACVGAGLALSLTGYFPSDARRLASERREMVSPQPWLWRDDWASGRIAGTGKTALAKSWIFTLVWNVIFCSALVLLLKDKSDNFNRLFLLFPVAGAGLLVYAVFSTLRWARFGQSWFKMPAVPGIVGGSLSGTIETSVKIKPKDGFHLKLTCIRRAGIGDGKRTTETDRILWQDEKTLLNELPGEDPHCSIIPVFFQIPQDCRPTDDTSSSEQTIWRLEARAKLPGVDYRARFEVPIFCVTDAAPAARVMDPTLPYQAPIKPYQLPAGCRILIHDLPTGAKEFLFPPLRNPEIAGLLVVGAASFSALAWFTTSTYREFIFFHILTGTLSIALWLVLLDTVFKSVLISADEAGLVIVSNWVFFHRTKHLSVDEISEISATVGLTVGGSAYYDLRLFTSGVRTTSGRWRTVVRSIRDKKEAEWLAEELRRSLRLDKASPTPTIST